ncbi:MAG: hypothetical protein U5K81_07365 [Trueperaceae bacterium]|nr:hypothetical protein [Trueperaceae bacterium]
MSAGRPRVLFAMITVGNGHRTSAEALSAWVEREAPGRVDSAVLDFTAAVGDTGLDRRHKASWRWMLRAPAAAYLGQRALDEVVPARISRAVQGAMLAAHARHAAAYLRTHRFDLVVATHFFTVQALALARRRHGLNVPVVGVNPDAMDAHALWAEPHVDAMVVFSRRAAADLARHGVPEDKIARFDFVARPEFDGPCPDAAAPRRALSLDPGRFTVLWSAGGEGIGGPLHATVARLRAQGVPVTVLAACGRNEALRARLARDASEEGPTRVVPLGFRSDMRRLTCAADLLIGKAGPASTFEALLSGRPVVHTGYAAANEKAIADYVVRAGVGTLARRPRALAELIAGFAAHPDALDGWRHAIAALDLRNGGPDVASWLLRRFLTPAEASP